MNSGSENGASASSGGKPLAFERRVSDGSEEILQLPASDPNADIPTITLRETIKFDEMGPIIINVDGTT